MPSVEAIISNAESRGIVTVCAAGNDASNTPKYPASYSASISVIATDYSSNKADYSNYGATCDISAPGTGIYSTVPVSSGIYGYKSGTSMATPVVSGTIALLFATNPTLTAEQVKLALYNSATDLGVSGKDDYFGWGLVNPSEAIQKARCFKWKRIYGSTRYKIMDMSVSEGWEQGSCQTVVVATGESFPDALAGSSLAGIYNAPIVLTSSTNLSAEAASQIRRLGPQNVIIIGGTGVVSNTVKNQIEAITGAGSVRRIAGPTRYDTANEVYNSTSEGWSNTLIVATGLSAADVLSIAPYAYATASPIFLSDINGQLNNATITAIQNGSFEKAIIIGSNAIVSQNTQTFLENQLGAQNIMRIYGTTRYETSSLIAEWACGEDSDAIFQPLNELSYEHVGIANGSDDCFADALVGGALCGGTGSVMLLAQNNCLLSNYTIQNSLSAHTGEIQLGYVFGGSGVLSGEFLTYLETICS